MEFIPEYDLSVCIPSKRRFEDSKDSISSAIGFCESTKSELQISDNSQDEQKKEFWTNISLNNFNYFSSNCKTSGDNWHNAAKNAKGGFIGMCSDDDLIINISNPDLNYSLLPHDIVGIKPSIKLWSKEVGFYRENNFSITDETPLERVISYSKLCSGNNTTLYSFFKSETLKEIQDESIKNPIKSGTDDWSLVMALVASGKIIIDTSKLYIYRNQNWISQKQIIDEQKKLYRNINICDRALHFSKLFRALNGLTYLTRKKSNIKRFQLLEAANFIFKKDVRHFLIYYHENKNLFLQKEKEKISLLELDNSIEKNMDIALQIISIWDFKVADKYLDFYKNVTGNDWGIVK